MTQERIFGTDKLFTQGERVELLTATIGVADGAAMEVVIPAGTIGVVVCVRECDNPPEPVPPGEFGWIGVGWTA